LRATIRDAIARGITLVLDQERFLHRVTDVIAESTGNRSVAAYIAEGPGEHFALGAATPSAPAWLPKRLTATSLAYTQTQLVATAAIFGAREELENDSSVVLPLMVGDELQGAILILGVVPEATTDEDLEAFAVVAEEIAPAVRVAKTHETLRGSIVRDMDTGAYIYTFFVDRLEQEISRAQRSGHSVTIVLVEALDFDAFEAAAGYELADRILRDLASGFAVLMRTSDVVARRGRTGFALLLPDSNVEGADVTFTRIEQLLVRVEGSLDDDGYSGPKPGIIAGSATYPSDGHTTAALVLAAEQRMLANETSLALGE
jgi:diguanylate cyclase (GGDEF)-like protein